MNQESPATPTRDGFSRLNSCGGNVRITEHEGTNPSFERALPLPESIKSNLI